MDHQKYRLLLSQKQYLKLLLADCINRFGDGIDTIAYSWIMYEITGSESLMALVVGMNFVPTIFLTPFAGAIVDRISKKCVMICADVVRLFIVSSIVFLYSAGLLTPMLIIAFTLLTSIVESFRVPASSALLPLLLDEQYYTLGKAANYSGARMAELLGYTLAGGIIAWVGVAGALWVDAATFLISAVLLSFVRYIEERKKQIQEKMSVGQDFSDGLAYIRRTPNIQVIALIGLLINFGIMPLTVFQTPYVSDYLAMGPETLSYIKILMSVGMMLGAAFLPKIHIRSNATIVTIAGITMGATLLMMSIAPFSSLFFIKMTFVTISMFFIGFGGGVLNVVIGSTMMKTVPKEMMGRVSGFISAIMQASMPISSFICSALAVPFNVTQIFFVFGLLTIFCYAFLYMKKWVRSL